MTERNRTEVQAERRQFRELILANPNYFGTAPGLDLPAVLPLANQTAYEQLTCVGLQPGLDQLEAVVQLKLHSGYAGTLCAGGSTEYVRFYLSDDGGTTWTDVGLTSFAVYDTPGPRPLDYAVDLHVPIHHRLCFLRNQPQVRAILSWQQPPPASTPGFTPVWGNVVEVTVAPSAGWLFPIAELLEAAKLTLPADIAHVIDPDAMTATAVPADVPLAELHREYEGKVEPHRYLFPQISRQLADPGPAAPAQMAQAALPVAQFAELGIDLGAILAALAELGDETAYERLDCIGYDPGRDALVGVLTIERPTGYSGGPCSAGSREFVAFWIDWGSGWEYAGTASAQVHDYPVPAGGLKFAVYQPIASSAHRKNCAVGPVQPAVRAILSWQSAPPPGNPGYVPRWGNRVEGRIQLSPGVIQEFQPVVETISGVPVCRIDPLTGLTTGAYQPFGAVLTVAGFIPGAPFRPLPGLSYRVRVRPAGSVTWQPLANTFNVTCTSFPGVQTQVAQSPDSAGFYPYLEDDNPANWRRVVGDVLAVWVTAQPMTGLWEILVESRDAAGTIYPAQVISCGQGQVAGPVLTVCLDEVAPETALAITGFVRDGVTYPADACMKFNQGDLLFGTYSGTDQHFGYLTLTLDPPTPLGVQPSPALVVPIQPATGASGTWQLDTTNLDPCGYVVRLDARDTTIVSGGSGGWAGVERAVGFSIQ
jgi:hypothetical protein